MKKLVDRALKLVLPTATAKAAAYPVGCHAGCGRNGVYRPGKMVNGKLPCC
jgi:hypothetical protein